MKIFDFEIFWRQFFSFRAGAAMLNGKPEVTAPEGASAGGSIWARKSSLKFGRFSVILTLSRSETTQNTSRSVSTQLQLDPGFPNNRETKPASRSFRWFLNFETRCKNELKTRNSFKRRRKSRIKVWWPSKIDTSQIAELVEECPNPPLPRKKIFFKLKKSAR